MEVKSARPAAAAQAVQPSQRAAETKQARPAPTNTQAEAAKQASTPKPMVNTQGHQTGRLLNATA